MDIRSVMAAVVDLQESLTVSEPRDYKVKKAWGNAPPLSVELGETPVVQNQFAFDREDRTTNGLRELYFTVRMQLLVYDADYNVASDIAMAFMASFVDGFDAAGPDADGLYLNGTATWIKLRGATPTIYPAQRGARIFAALELLMDVRLTEGKTYGAAA